MTDMLTRATFGLCLVIGGCGAAGADTDTDTEGGSTTSETASSPETVTSAAGMTTAEPSTTADSTTSDASDASDGTTGVVDTSTEGSAGISESGDGTTSTGGSESGDAESSTTDPDGSPFEGIYEGTMAADCVVGLLSGVLEFTVDGSGEADGEAAISFGAGGPLIAPVTGSVDDSGSIEATATVGGGVGSCAVTGTLFESGTGSGVFSCPVLACEGTWNANPD